MESNLRKLQLTQLEMLKLVDEICRENSIKYSLYAGTLLGAVRHKGFIPWDDDLDICMERTEYNRFIELWPKLNIDGFILFSKENAPDFDQSFLKIRKNHTTFLQEDKEKGAYHTGIFIDIFPIDRIPSNKVKKSFFKFMCMLYQLYTREFVPPTGSNIVKCVSKVLLVCMPKKRRGQIRNYLLRQITRYNSNKCFNFVGIETVNSLNIEYSPKIMEDYIFLPFEDGEYMCFKEWDYCLKQKYGDYMIFPPKENREWKHHPLILNFEKNYEEL